jgi:amino acid transporter
MSNQLHRALGLYLLTFYGLGNILGAGIYVLIGKVAASAGLYAPVSFFIASLVAGATAFSYAELSARLPFSAGEAVYMEDALGQRWLSLTVGLLIALAGMVSAATISRGFVGYLDVFVTVPPALAITVLLLMLGSLAAWGIAQSVKIAAFFTVLEIMGLVLVIVVAGDSLSELPQRLPELLPPAEPLVWQGIFMGAFLAFYAYIGFEDMVNVAEEVKEPQRTLPLAILLALAISTLLYFLVSLVATLSIPVEALVRSDAPLALIYQSATGREPVLITQIALVAVVNGALIQIIMAARVFYGMAAQGWLPAVFSGLARVHAITRTPLLATGLVTTVVLVMALWLPLLTLARITSFIVLLVFALVNLALLVIKRRNPRPVGVSVYPLWLPALALLMTVLLLGLELVR